RAEPPQGRDAFIAVVSDSDRLKAYADQLCARDPWEKSDALQRATRVRILSRQRPHRNEMFELHGILERCSKAAQQIERQMSPSSPRHIVWRPDVSKACRPRQRQTPTTNSPK